MNGRVLERGLVELVQMPETISYFHAGAYHRPSSCAHDAALGASVHAQGAQMQRHPNRIPGRG